MGPSDMGQVIALASLALALVTVAMTTRRDRVAERERASRRVAEQQVMGDKLDSISELSRETRDTVREVNRQLADHSRELARIEQQVGEHDRRLLANEQQDAKQDRRLSAMEGRCDARYGVGGTE